MPARLERDRTMSVTAPRNAPPAARRQYDLVLVGGVPGAGKTTAIARATHGLDHVRSVDPEHVNRWLRTRLPDVPYRRYRIAVHASHTVRVLVHLLRGPVPGRQVVIHDPGTRARRRGLYHGLARLAGWRTVLLYVDVDRPAAQEGQRRRGRVVRSFDEHWEIWERLRPALAAETQPDAAPDTGSVPVLLVDRAEAATILHELLSR